MSPSLRPCLSPLQLTMTYFSHWLVAHLSSGKGELKLCMCPWHESDPCALFKAEDKFGGDKRPAEVVTIVLTGAFAEISQPSQHVSAELTPDTGSVDLSVLHRGESESQPGRVHMD